MYTVRQSDTLIPWTPLLDLKTARRTDEQTERQTDRQAGRQADKHADIQSDRQTDILMGEGKTDTQIYR